MATRTPTADTEQRVTEQVVDHAAETVISEAVLAEALSIIDTALGQMMRRELVSSGEVTDVLLDVRTLLTTPAPSAR
ncbi:MAG: hypothetical protein ACKOAZ_02290 [Ilumatobacteraceae bacterium]